MIRLGSFDFGRVATIMVANYLAAWSYDLAGSCTKPHGSRSVESGL